MENKEFNLSEKICKRHNVFDRDYDDRYIPLEDVKEFIKRLKEELRHNVFEIDVAGCNGVLKDVKVMHKFIDKLAGEKLRSEE